MKYERLMCALFGHKYVVLLSFSSTSRKVGCTRCDKEWGMNDFERAFIPWDKELEEMYKFIGQWPKQGKERMNKDNIQKMKNVLEQQGKRGTWDYDPYMHGMYNGMELMMALAEGRDPDYREAPEKWLSKKEWVALTDDEVDDIGCDFATLGGDIEGKNWFAFYLAIEAKLKEKNK